MIICRIFGCGLLLVLLAACITAPSGGQVERVQELVVLLDEGSVESIVAASRLPFLLDSEIVLLERDLEALWSNVRASGFSFETSEVLLRRFVCVGDSELFGGGFEVDTYFDAYLPADARLIEIVSAGGRFRLLLQDARAGKPLVLYGLQGPL